MFSAEKIQELLTEDPLLREVVDLKPVIWLNPNKKQMKALPSLPLKRRDMDEAAQLWERFKPFFVKAFPETQATGGVIESPLKPIPDMQKVLGAKGNAISGHLYLKCDNALLVAGSIKARGGFFEVLHYAEELAKKAGLIKPGDDYARFADADLKKFFGGYKIGVASTGNLGLSIGIMSATLGFHVTVYMSHDAKVWKKNLLREKGAHVVEFDGDFGEAVRLGRSKTHADPKAYFVDDENSHELYLGYSVGALRLAKQLEKQGVKVDADHPLFVYSPCGVGGSPGGTAFGLKMIFGDHVHCFFAEPTHSPAVLVGLATGLMSNIAVQDLGIDNKTEADGLAVGRSSNFATQISSHLISGVYTIEDEELYKLLAELQDSEGVFLEPSATAGLIGPQMVAATDYAEKHGLNMSQATHIAWATGGDLVPDAQRKSFYTRGKADLKA